MNEKLLLKEIKTLKKAAKIHTKYSISQYKRVLKLLEELEKEKKLLEKKVKERTEYLKREIEQNIKLTQQLLELATYDPLTRLLNRRAFLEELRKLKNENFALMFLDLDGFKQVNDIYGHKIGDELLKIVAKRILNTLRKEDIVGRLGGDEFVIIIRGKRNKKDLEVIAKKLIEKISSPIIINKLSIRVGTSIGIYIYNKKDPIDRILSFADSAMYEAKRRGKGKFVFFSDSINKEFIKNELRKAIESGNLKIKRIDIFLEDKVFAYELFVEFEGISFNDIISAIEEDRDLLESLTLFIVNNVKEKSLVFLHYKLVNESFLNKLESKDICFLIDSVKIKYIKENILKEFRKKGFKIILGNFEKVGCPIHYLEYPINGIKINEIKDEKIFNYFLDISRKLDIRVILKCKEFLCIKN